MNTRDLAIIEMRLVQTSSYKTIGEKFGISVERVRQIITRYHRKMASYLEREQLIKKKIETESPHFVHVAFSDLSKGIQTALKSRGIPTTSEGLTRYSASDLLRFKGIGRKSLQEIAALLRMRGFNFFEEFGRGDGWDGMAGLFRKMLFIARNQEVSLSC